LRSPSLSCLHHPLVFPVLRLYYFFFPVPATTEIYTLSLHDALPISFSNAEIKSFSCFCEISFPRSIYSCTSLVGEVCAKARHIFQPIVFVSTFIYKCEISTAFSGRLS